MQYSLLWILKVKILRIKDNKVVEAEIINGYKLELPDIHKGWRFDFSKHSKDNNTSTYALVIKSDPTTIQGCLIYKMREEIEPYMAYIEIAPQNKGNEKEFENVAGCLIAYACRLSFILGKEHYKGWLAFDVLEEKEEDKIKLMTLYSKKYKAHRFGESTMLIKPEDGEKLIEKFLENNLDIK